jgi:hypothetical protein
MEMDLGASLVLVASLFPPILYCKTHVGPHTHNPQKNTQHCFGAIMAFAEVHDLYAHMSDPKGPWIMYSLFSFT